MIDILVVLIILILALLASKVDKWFRSISAIHNRYVNTEMLLTELRRQESRSNSYSPEEIGKIWNQFDKNLGKLKEEIKEK